jgi:hypothetical protein
MTPRTPDRQTTGALAAKWARLLGRELQDWQRDVLDVAGELDPATGRFAYNRVVLLAPRRAGKSLLTLTLGLATCSQPRRRAFYIAAHAQNAARMWRDDWFAQLASRNLGGVVEITRGNGTEAMTLRGGGTFRLVAASGAAIRGAATNLVVIDEAREISPDTGDDLEAAAFPTLATGAGGQAWIVSTAGDTDATWLARWRDLGRAAVADDRRHGTCFVEYAAPPGADPDDEATWLAAHPGLASGNVHLEIVRADREVMSADTFAAEYLGLWPEALVDSTLLDAWQAADAAGPVDLGDGLVLAVELDEAREIAVIVAVAGAGDGRIGIELLEHRPHGPWLGRRIAELVDRWAPAAVCYDQSGPAAALAPDLAEVSTAVVGLNTRETAAAAGLLYDRILAGGVAHNGDPLLDAAVRAARRRRVGGSWLFDRRQPGAGPLIAAALATWVHRGGAGRAPQVA